MIGFYVGFLFGGLYIAYHDYKQFEKMRLEKDIKQVTEEIDKSLYREYQEIKCEIRIREVMRKKLYNEE